MDLRIFIGRAVQPVASKRERWKWTNRKDKHSYVTVICRRWTVDFDFRTRTNTHTHNSFRAITTSHSRSCSGGASAVKEPAGNFEVRKSSSQVRSPGVWDAAKDLPVLNDLADLHCTYCTGCVKIN